MSIKSLKRDLLKLYAFSFFIKAYSFLKICILPLDELWKYLPEEGVFLDLGTGLGYIANFIALGSAKRNVIGIDIDEKRIRAADNTIGERRNIQFICEDIRTTPIKDIDFAVMSDVLHHIPAEDHASVMRSLYNKMKSGGIFMIRETNKCKSLKYFIMNYPSEVLFYPFSERGHFYNAGQLRALLESAGFSIAETIKSSPWFIYETIIYVCNK